MNTFSRIHAGICHANLFLAFHQIIYENAADTRICQLAFLWMLYYKRFCPYISKCQHRYRGYIKCSLHVSKGTELPLVTFLSI